MASLERILADCKLFAQVDAPGRARLLELAQLRRYEKGQLIFEQDEPCPGIFLVGSGRVRIYKVSATGKEHVLHLTGPGQTFAEVAVIGHFACPAHAEAIEDTECALLPTDAFNALLKRDHSLSLQILGGMAVWVRSLVGLMEDIVLRDATSRVASFLLQSTDAEERVQLPSLKKHLASHLNLTSETLSRSLRRLEEAGLIEQTNGGNMRLADREGLEAVSLGHFPEV